MPTEPEIIEPEIIKLVSAPTPEPTAEERLAGLEQAMLDMMGGMF